MNIISIIYIFFCSLTASSMYSMNYLSNNYTTPATNLQFYTANNSTTGSIIPTLNYNSSVGLPSNATYVTYADLNSAMQIPINAATNNSLFGQGSIINQSSSALYLQYTGLINGISSLINYQKIIINPNQTLPLPTGIGSIKLYNSSSSTSPIYTVTNASANNNYTITSNYAISTMYLLTNNSTIPTGQILFNTPTILTSIPSMQGWSNTTIPNNTINIIIQLSNGSVLIPTPSLSSINIFTNSIFTNNTNSNVTITLYAAAYSTTTSSGSYQIAPYQSMPIPTGTTGATATAYGITTPMINITAGSSYWINNFETLQISYYIPSLTNNGTQTANNVTFYNSNNALILPIVTNMSTTNFLVPPTNSAYLTMYNADLACNISIPTIFPFENIFTTNANNQLATITNASSQTIYINYFGTINGQTNYQLNSAPSTTPYQGIAIAPFASTYILTGASAISATSTSGSVPLPSSTPLTAGISYNINDTQGILNLTSTASGILTNNYSQPTGNITYTGTLITVANPIAPWSSQTIPSTATMASFSQEFNNQTATVTIPVNWQTSANIFTNYCIYNNYTQTVFITFYPANGTTPLTTPISVPTGSAIPILTTAESLTITSSGQNLTQTPISATTSYTINQGQTDLMLQPYTPMLTNNYTNQNGTNLTFLQSNNAAIATQATFNSQTTTPVPATASAATLNLYNVNLTVPVSLSPTSNIATTNTIMNTTNQSMNLFFTGTINNDLQAPFNTTPISLAAQNFIQILTGATNVTVCTTNNVTVGSTNCTGTSYFIGENDTNTGFEINQTIPLTNFTLTNNSNQTATNGAFYNTNNYTLESGITIASNSSISIPQSATTASITQNFNNADCTITIPIGITSSTIYSGYTITNLTEQTLLINFYPTSATTQSTTTPYISCPAGLQSLIPTGSYGISVATSNGTPALTTQPLNQNQSYYLFYSNNTLMLSTTPPATMYTITNNYNSSATSLTFYDQTTITGYGPNPLTNGQTAWIPATTNNARLNYLGTTNIQIPLLPAQNYLLTTPNLIINNSGEQIGIKYFSTINGVPLTPMNNNLIYASINQNSPILTSATNFSIYDNNNNVQISQAPINPNTSYTISSNWNNTPISGTFYITNNSGFYNLSGTNCIYYNNTTQLGTDPNPFTNGYQSSIIPGSTNMQTTINFNNNTNPTTITIPVSSSNSSSAFATGSASNAYSLTNNCGQSVSIIFYGPVPGTIMNTQLIIEPGQSIPLLQGATNITITDTNIINMPIAENTNYYLSSSNSTFYCSTYPSNATITQNYNGAPATNLQFFNGTTPLGTTIATFSYNQAVPIPTTATMVTFTQPFPFNASITIPINTSGQNMTTFAQGTLYNTSTTAVTMNFQGQNNSGALINLATILINPGISIPLITTTSWCNSSQIPTANNINQNSAYFVDLINNQLYLLLYQATAALTNNNTSSMTNLIFNNSTNSAPTAPQTVSGYNFVAVPTTSTSASFTDFSTLCTIPVNATTSANVFASCMIKNGSNVPVTIIFSGILNGTEQNFNQAPGISLAVNDSLPIFNTSTIIQVWYNNQLVLSTQTIPGLYPLPLNQSYTITYNADLWSILPQGLILSNNCNQAVTDIIFYDQNNNQIASTIHTITPWGSINIPNNSIWCSLTYGSSQILSIALSTQYDSRVFTNSLLINNSDQDVYINYFGTVGADSNKPLNSVPVLLQAGDALPFITGTGTISMQANDTTISQTFPVTSTLFYEITTATTTKSFRPSLNFGLRAASSDIQSSSSALGILRFIGGQNPIVPVSDQIALYGQNNNLFKQYIYVSSYAQYIQDATAQKSTIDTVNQILASYGSAYANQTNFNYISYFYLITSQLAQAKIDLVTQFPLSTAEINRFFKAIATRITNLLI